MAVASLLIFLIGTSIVLLSQIGPDAKVLSDTGSELRDTANNEGKSAFVFLGASGDNAMRDAGIWQGIFEAWSGGIVGEACDIIVAMNSPRTEKWLRKSIIEAMTRLHDRLQQNAGWSCRRPSGNCSPEALVDQVHVDVQEGYNSCVQAQRLKAKLHYHKRILMYMSIPPKVFGEWARCGQEHWSNGVSRLHVVAEKPFGTSLQNAVELHDSFSQAGIPDSNIHLVDHFLSFFMLRHMAIFKKNVHDMLGLPFDKSGIAKVVVTQYEARGLAGRGAFFDGVGVMRDMVQSHLLQVLALVLSDENAETASQGKLAVLRGLTLVDARCGQYDGFLLEGGLTYHEDFADATFVHAVFKYENERWKDVPLIIQTGKDMAELSYTIQLFEKDGPGILTYEYGKEETLVGGIKVTNFPVKQSSSTLRVPRSGLGREEMIQVSPAIVDGTGYILEYKDPNMYFPQAYSVLVASLITQDYSKTLVTWTECLQMWKIVESKKEFVDPRPENVEIYRSPENTASSTCNTKGGDKVCWLGQTVKDQYDKEFSCTHGHDQAYKETSLYQKKCLRS